VFVDFGKRLPNRDFPYHTNTNNTAVPLDMNTVFRISMSFSVSRVLCNSTMVLVWCVVWCGVLYGVAIYILIRGINNLNTHYTQVNS
jgi:hypothetical protein